MPPKKRKRQSRKTTQSQRQSQKVIVNIGSKPRKKSGRGGLPPPSHMHNLAPTFVTAPQIDYTPILAMLTQQTRSLQPEAPRNPVTPLSSVMATQTAERLAGEAAQRRAGNTAANFQPPPSLADERRRSLSEESIFVEEEKAKAKLPPTLDGFPEPVRKSVFQIKQELRYMSQQYKLKQSRKEAKEEEDKEASFYLKQRLGEARKQREADFSQLPSDQLKFSDTTSTVSALTTQPSEFSSLGQQPMEQDLTGVKRSVGRPSKVKTLAEQTARDIAAGKQTQLPFIRQGF